MNCRDNSREHEFISFTREETSIYGAASLAG